MLWFSNGSLWLSWPLKLSRLYPIASGCIFSWQRPSSLFASAQHIRFPSHEAGAYALRNYTTAEPIYAISKFVSGWGLLFSSCGLIFDFWGKPLENGKNTGQKPWKQTGTIYILDACMGRPWFAHLSTSVSGAAEDSEDRCADDGAIVVGAQQEIPNVHGEMC